VTADTPGLMQLK